MKKLFMTVLIGLVLTSAVFAACSVEFISDDYKTQVLLISQCKSSDEVIKELSKCIDIKEGKLVSTNDTDYGLNRFATFSDGLIDLVLSGQTRYLLSGADDLMIGTFRNRKLEEFLFEGQEFKVDALRPLDLLLDQIFLLL